MLVAGARPNFMKIASVIDAIRVLNSSQQQPVFNPVLVHTGQHYDEQMSKSFFRDLDMPVPDVDLEVGSGSHAHQTAEIMKRFEPILLKESPEILLLVGDVNSTVACSLVAAKVSYPASCSTRLRPLIAHVEAGLRSCDRTMPEEINRLLTDAISDYLFVTEVSAIRNLKKEGIPRERIYLVGNTMVDTLLRHRGKAKDSTILSKLKLNLSAGNLASSSPIEDGQENMRRAKNCRAYAVVTLHRPSNVDHKEAFGEILEALSIIARDVPLIFPVHPRTANRIREFKLDGSLHFLGEESDWEVGDAGIHAVPPLGYLDFLSLMSNASLVLTDSGGIQEETTVLGIPCVTLRENTERPITITRGTNVLAGTNKESIVSSSLLQLHRVGKSRRPRLWDGKAGSRIIKILAGVLAGR